jgi:hypothetical protein
MDVVTIFGVDERQRIAIAPVNPAVDGAAHAGGGGTPSLQGLEKFWHPLPQKHASRLHFNVTARSNNAMDQVDGPAGYCEPAELMG